MFEYNTIIIVFPSYIKNINCSFKYMEYLEFIDKFNLLLFPLTFEIRLYYVLNEYWLQYYSIHYTLYAVLNLNIIL